MLGDVRLLASLLVLGLGACGADLRRPADAGVTPSDRALLPADLGAPCPARVAPGVACEPGTRPCLGDDRCNDCFCTAGVWSCASRVCVDAGICPAARPRTGDACTASGQVCAYGAGCAGATCVCAGGRWTCDAFFCVDR